jgi:hypothetical protein
VKQAVLQPVEQSFAYQSHHSIIKPRHKQKMTYGQNFAKSIKLRRHANGG